MIALLHTSRGKLAARTKFHNVSKNEKMKGLARMVTSKNLVHNGAVVGLYVSYFCFVSFTSCIIRSKYSIAIDKIWQGFSVIFSGRP